MIEEERYAAACRHPVLHRPDRRPVVGRECCRPRRCLGRLPDPSFSGLYLPQRHLSRTAKPWRVPGHLAYVAGIATVSLVSCSRSADVWPWYGFDMPIGGVTIVERQAEAPPIDPYSFGVILGAD